MMTATAAVLVVLMLASLARVVRIAPVVLAELGLNCILSAVQLGWLVLLIDIMAKFRVASVLVILWVWLGMLSLPSMAIATLLGVMANPGFPLPLGPNYGLLLITDR